jgi:alkylation response protein AidB-like acyl-CoA dehydrogenase
MLTERHHGSDILANEVYIKEHDEAYKLYGEKWIINNATRSSAFSIMVKTNDKVSPVNYTMFFLDKSNLSNYETLAKIKTIGGTVKLTFSVLRG